jgi:hypothetical protein
MEVGLGQDDGPDQRANAQLHLSRLAFAVNDRLTKKA